MSVQVTISPENILEWSHMEDWENGTSSAPTEHTLSGASATVAREGTTVKVGTYSAAVTRVGADASLYHDHEDYLDYQGRKMTFACWVYATVASRARLTISDGVGSTNGSYHTGTAGWERLTVTHDIDSSATRMRVEMQVNTGNTTAYFDGGCLFEGPNDQTVLTDLVDVGDWQPANRFRGQSFKPSRRDGAIIPAQRLDQKTIRLKGMVIGTSPTATRTTFDTLAKALNTNRIKPDESQELMDLYLFDDRLIKGHLSQLTPKYKAALSVIDYDARFICPDPYFQSVHKIRSVTDISTSPATFTVTNNGTVLTRPIIRISATGGSITPLTLENFTSDQKLSYSGTITTGNSLVIDTDKLTVKNNGTGDLANFTGDTDMFLSVGDNELKFTGTNGDEIKIDYFERYI